MPAITLPKLDHHESPATTRWWLKRSAENHDETAAAAPGEPSSASIFRIHAHGRSAISAPRREQR